MTPFLTANEKRAPYLGSVYANAKAEFLAAIKAGDLERVLVPSELVVYGGRTSHTSRQRASDILIESATYTYAAQDSLAQFIVDALKSSDESLQIRAQMIVSYAAERCGDDAATRAEDDL